MRIDERALDRLRGAQQRVVERGVAERAAGGEPAFGQVHQRILQRAARRRGEVLAACGIEQRAARPRREAIDDQRRRALRELARVAVAERREILGACEHDERMRVQVLRAVERRALRVDTVKPAVVARIAKVTAQCGKERVRVLRVARLREYEQLARARHRAIAGDGQRHVRVRRDGLERQLQRRIEAGPAPDRQDDLREVAAQSGGLVGNGNGGGHDGWRRG